MGRSGGYKCYNIQCGSCIGKTLCGEPADSALGCVNRIVSNKTNADRIRAMSDEELAREIYSMQKTMCTRFAEIVGFKKEELNFSEDAPDILNWLRKPAEED